MSSVRKPRMPKPRIPKIKKPGVSKAKRLRKKLPALSTKKISSSKIKKTGTAPETVNKKKHHNTTRRYVGTCYLKNGCRDVLAKDVSKTQCKKMGGKSWKRPGSTCENLVE